MKTTLLPIMLIDDNPDDRSIMALAFEKAGILNPLILLESGDAALKYLHSQQPRPGLIFLDLQMPGLSGKEFLRQLKADRYLSPIPVIVLTGSSDESDVRDSYNLGASGYVTKAASIGDIHRTARAIKNLWIDGAVLPRI